MSIKINSASQPDYRNWNEQFNELNVPMPEQGAFAWRRQQLSLQHSSYAAMPEHGPSLLQRALASLKGKLSAGASKSHGLNAGRPSRSGAVAK